MKAKTGFNRFVSIFLSVAIAISALAGLSLGGLVSAAGEENTPMHIIVHLWHTVNIDGKVPADGSKDEVVLDGYFWKKGEGSYSFNGSSTDPTSNTKPTETSNVNREFSELSDTITIYSNVRREGNKEDGKALENYAGFSVSAGHIAIDMTDEGNNSALTIQFNENVHLVKVHIFYTNTSMYVAGTNNENELVSGTSSVKFEDDRDTFYAYIDGDSIVPIENNEIDYYLSLGKELTKYYNTAEGLHTDKTAMETAMAGMDDGRTFDLSLESWFVGNKSADIGLILDASGSMVSPSGDMKAIQLDVSGYLQKHFGEGYQLIDENGFLLPEVVDYILDPAMTDSSSLGVSGFKYYLFDAKTSNNDFFPLGYWNGEDKGTDEVTIDSAYTYDIPQREHLIGYYPFSTSGELAYDKEENEINNQKVSRVEKQDISSFNLSLNDDLDIKYSDSDGFRLDESAGGIKLNLGKDGDTKLGQNFTISFKIKSDKQSTNPANIKEILYIGPEENVDNNYFKAYRNSGESSARFVAESGGNKALNVNTVFNVGNKSSAKETYITLVFSNGEVKAYTNGTEADDSASSNTVTLADENIIILNGLSDSYGSSPHIRLDELYVFDLALGSQDVKDMYEKIQSKNKNIDINEKSTITTGGDVYLAKSGDNVLGTIQKSVYNKAEKATDSDSPMRGWYYVSFGSDWDNYFSEVVGTAKDYRHVYGPASVYENDAEKKKGEEGRKYDLVYKYDADTATGNGEVFYYNPADCYTQEEEPSHIGVESKYTLIDGRTLEDYPDECRISSLTYRPTTGSDTSDDNPSPIKFFIDKNGNLCCFFATGRSDKDMDGSYGWSYVFEKDDDAETKVESLQKALGSFTSGLFEGLPSSKVSAVRFSSDKIPIDTDSDKLVLLGWTSDPVEAGKMLSLQYGEGSGKGSSVSPTLSEGDSEGKNKQDQYNYGLTGGTTTQYGIQAYIDNLKEAADEDENAEKYLIIFTDGKDTDLSVKATSADGKVTVDDVQTAIDASEAYKKLKTLKEEDNYTVFCVMLTGGVMNASTSGEIGDYEQALQFLVELSSDGGTYSGVGGKYPHVFVGDGSNLTAMFDAINEEISADLENYTVQDYIDPRFDLVDAAGNVWNLNADGAVTCGKTKSVTIYQKGEEATDSDGDGVVDADSDGDIDVDGDGFIDKIQAAATKLDKYNYAIINLPNSNNEEGTTAKLYFDNNAEVNMYYLVWDNQDIPSCVKGDTSLKVWNATVTVRAKDDFIGGNAVTTNGNGADQNYVYMNDDTAPSSGTTDAGTGYDPATGTYPSKGFPRTTVNVAVPSLVLTGGEQVIYMGEELTPDGVAEKLGETILDKWATVTGADKSGTQWYWEYLERYAKYNSKDLEDIIKDIVAAENDEGSITYPYFYIPNPKNTNQTGSSDHHEKDQLGTLKFTWTTVDEDKDGSDYPNDNMGGTTVDTLQRVSTLTVRYIPLQAEDRKESINEHVKAEGEVYPWDPEYKPSAGEPTDLTTTETEEDKTPDDNGLLDKGSYTTNIVRGQINLDWEASDDVLDDLINFFPNKTIKYTADLMRSYNGKETKVGKFEFSIVCDETAKEPDHKVTLKLEDDFKSGHLTDMDCGLPIGEYYIQNEQTTIDGEDLSCLTFTAKATAIDEYVEQFAEDIYKHAPEAAAAAAITSDDITKYAAPFSDVNIQLGYNKAESEKTDPEKYINHLLGMYIASPTLLKGDLSITKKVEDTATFTAQHEAYGNQTFTFEVTLEGVSGQFTLKHGDGTEEPIGTKDAAFTKVQVEVKTGETVTIEGIPAGTSYTVTEVTPPVGYTIDDDDKLTVTGEIKATGEGTAEANFKNIYRADGTSVFEITKTLIGRKWADDETFTFVVKPYEDDDIDGTTDGETISTKDAIEKGYVTMPEGSDLGDGTYKIAVAKNETDDSSFTVETDPISFTKEGTYKFTVSEIREEDQLDDVIIDDNKYLLTVEVFDDGESNLTASNYAYETCDEMEDGGFPFKNTVSTQIDFDITKVLKGREWDGDRFDVDIEYVPEESTKSYSGAEAPFIDASPVTISDEDPVKTTVTFYSVGTYTFTVKEANGTDSNMLYDEEYKDGHTVIVVVGQNDDVGLTITSITVDGKKIDSTSAADITITNEYTVTKDVSIDIPVTKTFADGKWIDGTYSFDIDFDDSVSKEDRDKITFSNKTITIEKEGESPNFGTISFNGIVLEEDPINGYSKTFKFVVKEQNGGDTIDGITYDDTVYNVEVTITDGGTDPTVTVTKAVGTDEVEEMSFENEYNAAPAEWTPKVQKTFTGREGDEWLSTDEFTFTITQDEDDDVKVTLPSSITIGKDTTDDHTASFGTITFNTEGIYHFTISEAEPTANGITKGTSDYKVTVEVTDHLKGQLEYTVTYTDSEDNEVEVTDNTVEFTNTYTPDSVTWTPYVSKTIVDEDDPTRGENWLEEVGKDTFTFTVSIAAGKNYGDNVMPKNAEVIVDHTNHTSSVPFDSIKFTKGGTYEFVIKETEGEQDGIIYDHTKYNVTVEVSDDTTNGTLSIASVTYKDREGDLKTETGAKVNVTFPFINKHHHDAVKLDLSAQKKLTGRDWHDGDEFTFTVTQDSSDTFTAHMPTPNTATVKGPDAGDFSDITFTEVGEYHFTVKENELSDDVKKYITPVVSEHKVYVKIDDHDGKLYISEMKIDGKEVTNLPKPSDFDFETKRPTISHVLEFENKYSAKSAQIQIPVSKVLDGREWNDGESFTFEIDSEDYTFPVDYQKSITIKNTANNKEENVKYSEVFKLDFDLDDIKEKDTFTFTITEVDESSSNSHVAYSTEKYTVTVKVTDDYKGKLTAEITEVTKAGGTDNLGEKGVVFTNTYTPDPVEWTPSVSKVIEDTLGDTERSENWLLTDKFTFTITQTDTDPNVLKVLETPENVTIDSDTSVGSDKITRSKSFAPITFNEAGTYHFTIKEGPVNISGIYRDKTVYDVTVEVSDDTNGTLSIASVEYTYTDSTGKTVTEKATDVENVTFPFVNKHHHGAVHLDLSINKTIANREWQTEDKFEFTIEQALTDKHQVALPGTLTVTKSGDIAFDDAIMFTEIGEYNFTVKEINTPDYFKCTTPTDGFYALHIVIASAEDEDSNLYISSMTVNGKEVTNLPKPSDPDFETKRPTISHVLEFENKYSAKPAQIQIPVSKVLDGREWTADDSFTFTISPDTYSSTNTITITNKSDEYSEGDIEGYQGFFDLTFDLEDIDTSKEVNEFTFTISENSDSPIDHITYSKEVYTVTVKVTDNYTGKLTAEITEVTKAGGTDNLGENGVVFTNTYTPAPVTWTPSVTKEIRGRSEWNPNYSFGFTITPDKTDGIYYKDGDGNEQPYTAQDIFINSKTSEYTESFKTVIFKKADTYTFTVKETVPVGADENKQLNGITYDGNDHKIVVTVIDNEGQLEISAITVDGKDVDVTTEGTVTTNVTIINTYSANGSWPPVVEKSFDTRNWDDSDNGEYTFVLSLEETPLGVDSSAVTIPNGGKITISGGNAGDKSVTGTFGDVVFTQPGTYEFKLTEKTYTGGRGVTSAETVYNITVNVTDNGNGTLAPTVSAVTKDGEEYNGTNYAFVNTYTPEPATWTPSVQKKLEGADWNDYTFTFSITPLAKEGIFYDDATTPYEYHEVEISSAADNTAKFNTVTFTKAGTYVFTIAEADTGIEHIVYDKTDRSVTVVVVDDPVEGKLGIESITVSVGEESYTLDESDNISFTNYYTENAIVKNAIKVEKELDIVNGRDWLSSDTFSFRLTLTQGDASNVVMKVGGETVDELTAVISGSDPTKSAVFSDIEFTAEGTYVFTVSEIIPNGATGNVYQGVTYDENPYEVTVEVTLEEEIIDDTDPDNIIKEYYLVAEVQDNDDGVNDGIVTFSFTNTAVPATLAEAINVKKTLDGKDDDWGSDSFSFKIEPDVDYGEDVVMPTETEISISAADAPDYTAYFDKIIFNKVGEYHFTVSEVLPEGVDSNNNTLDNITYDVNTHEVVVKVDVDANNNLVATIQGENDVALSNVTVEFTNKYTSPSTPTHPSTDPTPPTDPTPSTPTQPSENTTSEDTSAPEQTTGPEETTPEETTSEATTASSEESTVPSEETTPDTTDSEDVSENDGYNTNVDGDGDKNMNTGVPFGSAIMMCALSSLAVAVAVRKKKNGRNDK